MNIPKELIIILAAAILPATSASTLEIGPQQRTSDRLARSAVTAQADTLYRAVPAGDILIFDLPEELDGRPVRSYALLRAPALSWLVDYSFMWRTFPQDSGTHEVLIRADTSAEPDTLVISIAVE